MSQLDSLKVRLIFFSMFLTKTSGDWKVGVNSQLILALTGLSVAILFPALTLKAQKLDFFASVCDYFSK